MSPESKLKDVRLLIVDQARWGMSAHNMQPWEIVLDKKDPQSFRISAENLIRAE